MAEHEEIVQSNDWRLDDGGVIRLLTPKEFSALRDGTQLICIDGETVTKGVDKIDQDTRGGFIAFGRLVCKQGSP